MPSYAKGRIESYPLAKRNEITKGRLERGVCIICAGFSEGHTLCDQCAHDLLGIAKARREHNEPFTSESAVFNPDNVSGEQTRDGD